MPSLYPEGFHLVIGHELSTSSLRQTFIDCRPLFVIHDVDAFAARGGSGDFCSPLEARAACPSNHIFQVSRRKGVGALN
jgi:hypothetical protein